MSQQAEATISPTHVRTGAAPHLLTHRGDAVTGPGSAGRTEKVPQETAEMYPECG